MQALTQHSVGAVARDRTAVAVEVDDGVQNCNAPRHTETRVLKSQAKSLRNFFLKTFPFKKISLVKNLGFLFCKIATLHATRISMSPQKSRKQFEGKKRLMRKRPNTDAKETSWWCGYTFVFSKYTIRIVNVINI